MPQMIMDRLTAIYQLILHLLWHLLMKN